MLGYLVDGLMALGGNSFSTDGKISSKLYMCLYTDLHLVSVFLGRQLIVWFLMTFLSFYAHLHPDSS